jgi:effector-binding domain-containing protein
MTLEPKIERRDEQHYVAIQTQLKRKEIPKLLPPLIPELFKWIEENDIQSAGCPFFSYSDTNDEYMQIDVGIPIDSGIVENERIHKGIFPEGKYAVVIYTGNYSNLYKVHENLVDWAEKNGIQFKGARTEFYPTDPVIEPDPKKWKTIIVNQVVDD